MKFRQVLEQNEKDIVARYIRRRGNYVDPITKRILRRKGERIGMLAGMAVETQVAPKGKIAKFLLSISLYNQAHETLRFNRQRAHFQAVGKLLCRSKKCAELTVFLTDTVIEESPDEILMVSSVQVLMDEREQLLQVEHTKELFEFLEHATGQETFDIYDAKKLLGLLMPQLVSGRNLERIKRLFFFPEPEAQPGE